MARAATPTFRRRELAARLRELRLAAGLTIDQVADRLLVSATKISRLETAARPASARDVRDLVALYEVDPDERERLLTLARQSREQSWWQQYDDRLSSYIGLETAAVAISDFESGVVPALLQTREYAAALSAGSGLEADPAVSVAAVDARMRRHAILTADRPPRYHAIVDEAALRRLVGGPEVMRSQVEFLLDRAALPSVSLQIIPFESGAHQGMDSTFTILEFGEPIQGVVYVEGLIGSLYLESPADLARYHKVFNDLRTFASSPAETEERLAQIVESYRSERNS